MTTKFLKQPEPLMDLNDDEARYRRHEDREADRRHQRERERLCLPFEDWPAEYQRDLEYEVEQAFRRQRAKDRNAKLAPGSVNPFWPTEAGPQEPA